MTMHHARQHELLAQAATRRAAALGLCVLVALLWPALWSPSATAAEIPGDPLRILMDGSGHLQARFADSSRGELRGTMNRADGGSGMAFTIATSPTSWGWCGTGLGSPPTPLAAPAVSGSGSAADPYRMSTSYACGTFAPQLEVTQTFVYVNGESAFLARYTFTNVSTGPLSFDAINRGVFSMAGSQQGQGFFDETRPRTLGVFNDQQGSEGGFMEATSAPWTSYLEDAAPTGNPYEPGASSLFGPLGDTFNPTNVTDPRTAVYFDRYLDPGLAPGATDSFEVVWFFGRYDGLSLSPQAASQAVGQPQSVAAGVLNHGQPVSGATVRYAIAGANPASGHVATTDDGSAAIAWTASRPGQDTLTAYVDSDDDGSFDPAIDTQQVATVTWTGAAPLPPPPPPPPPPAAAVPKTSFAVLATRVTAAGLIKLTLRARKAGVYRAVGTSRLAPGRVLSYGRTHKAVRRGERTTLTIRPTAAAKRRLRTARLRVAVAVTFTPAGGAPATKRRTVVVKARARA